MGAVVDIAAAFVLLVAGGCARAVGQPFWRRFVHWCRTEGQEPPEFKFMDRLVESMVAKPKEEVAYRHYKERCSCQYCNWVRGRMSAAYTGTKNAGKVPGVTSAQREVAEAEARRLRKIEKWERRLEQAEQELIRARLEE